MNSILSFLCWAIIASVIGNIVTLWLYGVLKIRVEDLEEQLEEKESPSIAKTSLGQTYLKLQQRGR